MIDIVKVEGFRPMNYRVEDSGILLSSNFKLYNVFEPMLFMVPTAFSSKDQDILSGQRGINND